MHVVVSVYIMQLVKASIFVGRSVSNCIEKCYSHNTKPFNLIIVEGWYNIA